MPMPSLNLDARLAVRLERLTIGYNVVEGVIAVFALKEGREAWQGELVEDDDVS